jgi:hypothetical protein
MLTPSVAAKKESTDMNTNIENNTKKLLRTLSCRQELMSVLLASASFMSVCLSMRLLLYCGPWPRVHWVSNGSSRARVGVASRSRVVGDTDEEWGVRRGGEGRLSITQ